MATVVPSGSRQAKAFESIEGLRGFLALSVCLGHCGLGGLLEALGYPFHFHLMVDVFFVISGFVLAHSNYYANQKISVYDFTVKRLARLYPLHFFTLLLMCILNFLQSRTNPSADFFQSLFLIDCFGPSPTGNAFNFPSWSISVEFMCSIFLLFLCRALKNTSFLIGICLGYIFLQSLYLPSLVMKGEFAEHVWGIFNAGLLRGLAGTCLGVVLFLSYQSAWGKKLFSYKILGYCSFLCFLGYLFFAPITMNSSFFYGVTFILVGNCAYSTSFLKLLATKAAVYLGAISYSIYLLHIPLYHSLQVLFGESIVKGVSGKLILLPCIILLSVFSYYYLEVPLQAWIRRHLLVKTKYLGAELKI